MDLGLKDKVVLVCAASQGLGKAVAQGFVTEGAKVAICARSNDTLQATRAELIAAGGNDVLAFETDLRKPADLQHLIEGIQSQWGAIDVLVNNAGGPPPGSHLEISDEQWQHYFELTVRSAARLTELVLPDMKEAGWGRIINISSFSVKQPMANMMLSNSLRLSVLGWAKTLANEVAANGILVNTVCPGWTQTNRVSSLLDAKAAAVNSSAESIKQAISTDIPLGRMAEPEEIANAVLFYASSMASYITGTALAVDGGQAQVF